MSSAVSSQLSYESDVPALFAAVDDPGLQAELREANAAAGAWALKCGK